MPVALKCSLTYISIPVADVRYAELADACGQKTQTKSKIWGNGKKKKQQAKAKAKRKKPTKKDKRMQKIRYVQWPVMNPQKLFHQIIQASAMSLVQSENWCWLDFWGKVQHKDFAKDHPVLQLEPSLQRKAVAITVHGDEGQSKRSRNILIVSWSSIAIHGPSLHTKFPFCAPWIVFLDNVLAKVM